MIEFEKAEQFLKDHYCTDDLAEIADTIRYDDEHWEMVMSDPKRWPNANVEWITEFGDAASTFLGLYRERYKSEAELGVTP